MASSLFVLSSQHKGEHYNCSLLVDRICYVPICSPCSVFILVYVLASIFSACFGSIFGLCYVSIFSLCYVFMFSLCYVWCLDTSDPRSARVALFAR